MDHIWLLLGLVREPYCRGNMREVKANLTQAESEHFSILEACRRDSKYVNLRWVLAAPGPISDSDIELASTCPEGQRVMILGFNTTVSSTAERTAKDGRHRVNFTAKHSRHSERKGIGIVTF